MGVVDETDPVLRQGGLEIPLGLASTFRTAMVYLSRIGITDRNRVMPE